MRIWTYLTHQICESIENRYTNPNRKNRLPNIWVRFSEKKNLKQKANKPKTPFQNFEIFTRANTNIIWRKMTIQPVKTDQVSSVHYSEKSKFWWNLVSQQISSSMLFPNFSSAFLWKWCNCCNALEKISLMDVLRDPYQIHFLEREFVLKSNCVFSYNKIQSFWVGPIITENEVDQFWALV